MLIEGKLRREVQPLIITITLYTYEDRKRLERFLSHFKGSPDEEIVSISDRIQYAINTAKEEE